MDIEVCVDSVAGAVAASKCGATRIELCSALDEGGLSPSIAMVEHCVKNSTAEVYVMVRPSSGGFVYSDEELLIMQDDIIKIAEAGAQGVVFGILNSEGNIDVINNRHLVEVVKKAGIGATFHRAFDGCNNPGEAIGQIIDLGFNRILTSGGKAKALQGIGQIKNFVRIANHQIEVMAGSGVNPGNASILAQTGIDALHFTARKIREENMVLGMGIKYEVDAEKIKTICRLMNHSR